MDHPVLGSILQGHNPQLSIQPAVTFAEIATLEPRLLRHARLITFGEAAAHFAGVAVLSTWVTWLSG